jgi:hypothetical protein
MHDPLAPYHKIGASSKVTKMCMSGCLVVHYGVDWGSGEGLGSQNHNSCP